MIAGHALLLTKIVISLSILTSKSSAPLTSYSSLSSKTNGVIIKFLIANGTVIPPYSNLFGSKSSKVIGFCSLASIPIPFNNARSPLAF